MDWSGRNGRISTATSAPSHLSSHSAGTSHMTGSTAANSSSAVIPPRRNATNHVIDELFHPDIALHTWRHTLAFYIDTSGASRAWELVDALVNLAFCTLYIVNTTYTKQGLPDAHRYADCVLAAVLLAQFIPKMIIVVDWYRMLMSPLSVLTWIATVPVFLTYSDQTLRETYMSAGLFAFLYPFRFMRLHLAILACLVRLFLLMILLMIVSTTIPIFYYYRYKFMIIARCRQRRRFSKCR
jgi:hypothetical protein